MDPFPSDSTCNPSCVKLYLCSNPEDSVVERRALRESVFPKIRELCRTTAGLDVRVIDPFESTDPSRWPDECTRQQLIKECRDSTAGPFLLALIGHQYGKASLPVKVEVSEYQLLLQESQRAGVSTQQLERVYQRDENTIPPSFCLRPEQAEVNEGEQNVVKAEEELRKVFQTTVSLCTQNGLMSPERAQIYYRSALDTDLRFALDNRPDGDIARRCLVYINKVVNAKGDREKGQMTLHQQPQPEADPGSAPTERQLFSDLCENFLRGLITSHQLLVYTITTECDRRHGYTTARRRGYAELLCQQVYSDVLELIYNLNMSETREEPQSGDALGREQAEQEELCDSLSRFYDVIRPEEEEIKAYVKQKEQQWPLVVTGGPCTGKTVLLAHCAQQINSWLPDSDPVVITYFSNLQQPLSSNHLLSSLCNQIAGRYHSDSSPEQPPTFCFGSDPENQSCITNPKESSCSPTSVLDSQHEPVTKQHISDSEQKRNNILESNSGINKPDVTLSELKRHLSSLLSLLPSSKKPLVLILDGLDQIENTLLCPQIIESFPSPIPADVKLILTVSSSRAHVLQAVGLHYPQCSPKSDDGEESGCFCVQLGMAERKGCARMLLSLLSSSGRRVTSGQQVLVNQALTSCCLTLYARLLHAHTSLWCSDSDLTESSLPDGVHSSISLFLDHLEQKHGSSIVARAVSYLTLSRTGLTEVELSDLLSSDNDVLSDYVQQGESASFSMRVPEIDLERLLLDLRMFLIRKTFSGSPVLFWASRHFKLVVTKRYFSTQEERREIHSEMADYFSGQWVYGNAKPLLVNQKSDPNKETAQIKLYIDRQLPKQPFVFTSSCEDPGGVNLRKVVELPYHLQQSSRWEELEHMLLMSFGFHQAMVRVGLLVDLVTMLESDKGSSQSLFLREKLLLASILTSSACLLQNAPLQLPAVMETSLLPYLEVFPALEGYVREIRQERRSKGSGLGVTLCPAPSSVPPIQSSKCDIKIKYVSVSEAAGTKCGIVAEIMDDCSAWVWKGLGCDVVKVSLSCEQEELKFAGVKSSGRFMLFSTECNKLFLWDVTDPGMFLEVKDPLITEVKPKPGQKIKENKIEGFVECQKMVFMWWKDESFVSVFNVSSETLTHLQCQNTVTFLACSSNGFYVYCGQEEGTVSIFDTVSSSLLGSCTNSNHIAVALIIIGEDRGEMTCVDRSGNVALWDIAAKTQPPRCLNETFPAGNSSSVLNTDYSEETDTLLVCQSHQVTLWNTHDWEPWDQFLAPQGKAFAQAVLSQDGHLFLASLDASCLVLVWRVSTGECVLSLVANKQPHTLLKTASGVICVAEDGCLSAWDSEMIDAAGAAPKIGGEVKELVVEQKRDWFYTTDGSETVWSWRLDTGLPHAKFLHDGPVEKMCLSPDDIHLVTLSGGEIYVWQTETGQNILRISGSRATDILITHNGNFGVSISDSGLSRVWKLAHGNIVCSIHLYLSNAKVSPESTFLIGHYRGDLLAASLWSGSISKRFSCASNSEHVVAFQTLSEHPDFVVVMTASGGVYTWKVAEETLFRHFQLPYSFLCQPQDFQMSSDGSFALLSTNKDKVRFLDLSQVQLCSFKAEGPVIKACLDRTGYFVAYITLEETCPDCDLHARPVLTVVRLMDGKRVGSVFLSKKPTTLVVHKQRYVFVGFEDGAVGVYSVSDIMINREEVCSKNLIGDLKQCPCDRTPLNWLPVGAPNVTWP